MTPQVKRRCLHLMRAMHLSLVGLAILLSHQAHAGTARFVSGTAGYASAGVPMAFFTTTPLYFTDPGDLSATVTHTQADAMVAAAASVWNVPETALTLAQGGTLAEHVSSANTYFNGTNLVFPSDVEASNYQNVQIAVLYDTDGSLVDLLLGSGASDPTECRQNGVIESVDSFANNPPAIDHAIIVLNGRCVTSTTERTQQMLQMQYQLERVFGRVIGLSWSQLNDNVFTGEPYPTALQMANWPVMHPLDIVCGAYTYQCIQDPFTLRIDDLSALALLYKNYWGPFPGNKQLTTLDAVWIFGDVSFPDGQQAEMVNLQLTRWFAGNPTWDQVPVVSAVTGYEFQQNGGNPVAGPETAVLNGGTTDQSVEGYYSMTWVPTGLQFINVEVTPVPINPLYWGEYAIGPYQRPVIDLPSVQQPTGYGWTLGPGQFGLPISLTLNGMPGSCDAGNDGTEASPAAAPSTGWWSGTLCGVGHASWYSTAIRAGHTWTIEATATDVNGDATVQGVQPVLGVWNMADPTGTLPTVAAEPTAMNSMNLGMTQLLVSSAPTDSAVRFTVADQYGGGRPDFTYRGRIFYADSITPAIIPESGAAVTITGTGFQQGNTVTINGVRSSVLSWSPTQIVAIAPTSAQAMAGNAAVDVLVSDATTGATSDMGDVLTYANIAPTQTVVTTTPNAYVAAGAAGQWTIALSAAQSGIPAAGIPIAWSTTSTLSLAAAQTTTNASGAASTTVASAAIPVGASVVSGCAWTNVCAPWSVFGVDPSLWSITIDTGAAQSASPGQSLAPVVLQVTDGSGHALAGATASIYQTDYAWEGSCAGARCPSAPVLAFSRTSAVSNASGLISVTPLIASGLAQTVAIAVATGNSGFATTTLTIHP